MSRMPKIFWWGVALFVLGTGPLIAIIIAAELGLTRDPNPNPIGPGLLAFVTFWPSIILMIVGVVKKFRGSRPRDEPPVLKR